jgi:hypothetical protein
METMMERALPGVGSPLRVFPTTNAERMYALDEAWNARDPYRPFQQRPKASEWRWLEYVEPVPILGFDGSPLWKRINKLGMVDQGTGSTFSALADRGLVNVRWHRVESAARAWRIYA